MEKNNELSNLLGNNQIFDKVVVLRHITKRTNTNN